MQTRQSSICFPIRKTRSSRINPEKPVVSAITPGLDASCFVRINCLDSPQKCSCKGKNLSKVKDKFSSPQQSYRKTKTLSRTTDKDVSPDRFSDEEYVPSEVIDISYSPPRSLRNKDTQSKTNIYISPHKFSNSSSLIGKSSCKVETSLDLNNLQGSPRKFVLRSALSTSGNEKGEADENQKTPRKVDVSSKAIDIPYSPRRSSRKKGTQSITSLCSSPQKSQDRTSSVSKLSFESFSLEKSSCKIETSLDFNNLQGSSQKFVLRSASSTRGNEEGEAVEIQMTPRKQKLALQGMEDGPSPSKRPVVVLNRLMLESPKPASKACRRLMSDPTKLDDSHLLSSPRKAVQSLPLSPNKLSSPQKFSTCIEPRITRLHTPQKSSASSSASISSSDCVNVKAFQSPSRCPVRCLDLDSPVKNLPPKQPNLDFVIKSPLKRLDMGSPRRSPRKFNQENRCNPRKSPRKLPKSPMQFSSPSSLVSRLSLASPTSNKNVAVSLFKPDVSAYCALRQSLNTGTPTVLVCREKLVGEMQEFLTHHLTTTKSGSIYISGAPGTGKTASLISILDNLKENKIKRVFLNCMTLKTSAAIYKTIVTELGLKVRGTERENIRAIEKAITTSKCPVLIMLDEVDQLDNKNQEVLYTLFEWPALAGSRLVLVGIANSLDLTDRILPRLQARPTFKPKLLHFPPYTKAEIVKIINQRVQEAGLGDLQIIRPSAIQLLAGKVASVAGDARKALDVCRRAVESCEIQARRQSVLKPSYGSPRKSPRKHQENVQLKMVEVHQVLSIFNEIYGSRVISAVRDAPESFPLQQKVLICCLLLILKHARSKDVTLGKFHEVHSRICKKRQIPDMDQSEFLSMCTLLESRGMLQVKCAKERRSSKIILRLNAEEAEQTLGDRILLASILEDRESLGKMCKA